MISEGEKENGSRKLQRSEFLMWFLRSNRSNKLRNTLNTTSESKITPLSCNITLVQWNCLLPEPELLFFLRPFQHSQE